MHNNYFKGLICWRGWSRYTMKISIPNGRAFFVISFDNLWFLAGNFEPNFEVIIPFVRIEVLEGCFYNIQVLNFVQNLEAHCRASKPRAWSAKPKL